MNPQYQLSLTIHPQSHEVDVKGTLQYIHNTNNATQTLKLYLHKDFKNISFESPLIDHYSMDQNGDPLSFLDCSRPLTFRLKHPLQTGESLTFQFSYDGQLTFGDFPIGEISEDFTELGIYAPVFPVTEDMGNATFDLTVSCDAQMTFVHADLKKALFDFALIGSKHFTHQVIQQPGLSVYYALASDETKAKNIAIMCDSLLTYYTHQFGDRDTSDLKIVITPRTEGGGYCREGLIVLSTDVSEALYAEDIYGYLAHELAHLWWLKAPLTTFEDWLNESFAEFSRMLACKTRFGEPWYDHRIAKYKETYHTTPPIIGIDRNDPKAFEVLYKKGTAILSDVFQELSEDELKHLFHTIHFQKIASTDALLGLLEGMYGSDFAREFRLKLERL